MLGLEWIPRIRMVLCRDGLNYRDLIMVAWAMGEESMGYETAVSAYADYMGCTPAYIHGSIRQRLREAGIRMAPADYLSWVVEEVCHAH